MIIPVSLNTARQFVAAHHRHSDPPQGWLFGCGLAFGGNLVGVAIAGRPMHGSPEHSASRLYGAICRAAGALGYRRAITYTLATEHGVSLRASGFRIVAELEPRESWASRDRPRYDADLWGRTALNVARNRWERTLWPTAWPSRSIATSRQRTASTKRSRSIRGRISTSGRIGTGP